MSGPVTHWFQFNKVAQTLQPGGTLIIADGVYTDWKVYSIDNLFDNVQDMVISVSGTADQHIIIRAQTIGGVVLRLGCSGGCVTDAGETHSWL